MPLDITKKKNKKKEKFPIKEWEEAKKERKFPIKDRKKKKHPESSLDQTISEQYIVSVHS